MYAPLAFTGTPRTIPANPVSLIVIRAKIVHPVIVAKPISILIKTFPNAFYVILMDVPTAYQDSVKHA
jgi:hypothetical protein